MNIPKNITDKELRKLLQTQNIPETRIEQMIESHHRVNAIHKTITGKKLNKKEEEALQKKGAK